MKNTIYIFLFTIFFFNLNLSAQEKKDNQKIRAFKIAYLTEKLDLTTNEAEKFWPLFNQYHKQRRSFFDYEREEIHKRVKEGYTIDNITNKEAEVILKKVFEFREKQHQANMDFHKELYKILPAKKILVLEITEKEFNKKLRHKLKNKH